MGFIYEMIKGYYFLTERGQVVTIATLIIIAIMTCITTANIRAPP